MTESDLQHVLDTIQSCCDALTIIATRERLKDGLRKMGMPN